MAAKAAKKEIGVAEKLDALFELQKIDSDIDKIRTIRGELPLEVQDLEDEVAGLQTRISNFESELKGLETEISDRKNASKESESAISKYKEQQNNVRNNREYDSLSKEIEFQELEIKLHEKKSKEAKFKVDSKQEVFESAKIQLEFRTSDLATKKAELDAIIAETQVDEDRLLKSSENAKKNIEERLLFAYDRLRTNAKNGLAVVPVDRDACGGCFNKIPAQRQFDIKTKKEPTPTPPSFLLPSLSYV